MRTDEGREAGRPTSDLTARARIRDAAIECFASEGFGASFRTMAARAGVSAGLITHHFGSKDGLRAECDAEVLRRYRELKTSSLSDPSGYLLTHLAGPGEGAVLLLYLVRAIHAGGAGAQRVLEHLVEDAHHGIRAAVDAGLVRPSRDEEARTRYLAYQTMGALLIQFVTQPQVTPDEFVASMHAGRRGQILPTLELFTEGILADRRMLDDYLAYVADPSPGPADATDGHRPD